VTWFRLGKIGKWVYPDMDLDKALETVGKIHSGFRGRITAGNLAKLFGIEPRGGGFASKVDDLEAYGLVEGKGEYKLTPLAIKIIQNPSDPQHKAEAFLKVDLFKTIHNEFGGRLPEDNEILVMNLVTLLKEPEESISNRVSRIRNHYNAALKYLMPETFAGDFGTIMVPPEAPTFMAPVSGSGVTQSSDLLTVPPDFKKLVMPETFIVATKNDLESVNLLEDQFRTWIKHLRAKLTAKDQ